MFCVGKCLCLNFPCSCISFSTPRLGPTLSYVTVSV
uniref:Uncharacterized protein n=1 Tax=Anguilla anguilla TaxID=7936 RepID=A0A0E9PLL6_ANGAN